jgi:hypothetical protein
MIKGRSNDMFHKPEAIDDAIMMLNKLPVGCEQYKEPLLEALGVLKLSARK